VAQKLAAANPTNIQWQRDLSEAYEKQGEIMRAGKLDDARGWFDKALAVAQRLAVADPSNTQWQRDLSLSYERLGDVAVSTGKLDDARGWFDKALAVAQKLAAADPSNTQWQLDLCTSLAKVALVARDSIEAMKNLSEARTIYDHLQRSGFFRGDTQFARIGKNLDHLHRLRTGLRR
jgi:tetratricopeptide (TPR) repeat protein